MRPVRGLANDARMRSKVFLPLLLAAGQAAACGDGGRAPAAAPSSNEAPTTAPTTAAIAPLTPAPQANADDGVSAEDRAAAQSITPASIAAPIRFLADDALEGRAPGSRGGSLGEKYIATEFQGLGLQPGGDNGTYFQEVPLVSITAKVPKLVTATGPKGSVPLR